MRAIIEVAGELDDRWSRSILSASSEAEMRPRAGGKSGHHSAKAGK